MATPRNASCSVPFERLKEARVKQVCLGYMFGMRIVKNQDDFLTVVHLLLARNGLGRNDGQVNRQPDTELAFVWP